MILELSDIIKNDNGQMSIDCDADIRGADFLGEDFVFTEPVHIVGRVTNNTKNLELEAKAEGKMRVRCARCAKEFVTGFAFPIDEILVREGGEIDADSEAIVFSGSEVELDDIIINNFLMNVEGRYLCSEDCKGLCPVCGCDLNEGSCDCDRENIDPRWAKLAEIMKDTTTE